MRIGLLHNSVLPPKHYGGIERIVLCLANEFKNRGHEVVILCRKGSSLPGFEVFELPENYHSRPSSEWLPKGLEFLHAHEPLPYKPSIPYLVTIHGNGHPNEKYWPNTNFLSQSHARNHSAKYFIYNGINSSDFPYVEEKEDYVVFLARASWRVKNLKTCIEFANELKVRLEVIGGTGIDTKYVKYRGMLGDKDGKLEILSKAKALVYPTNWDEPCAVAPLESLACGTPVIASVNGCMPELVNEETGVVCSDYASFLKSWEKVQSLKPADCRASVDKTFSQQRMAEEYLNLMTKIIEVGELDQHPKHNFNARSIQYIYKPTLFNKLRFLCTGKI